jgi:uncharacterized peroxidase-related enzyme
MTWIKTIPPEQADESLRKAREGLRALFPPEYGRPVLPADVEGEGIVATHSLLPEVMYHAFATFGSLMAEDLPLTRRDHELIATVVSAANRCFYCRESHAEFLRIVTLDDALVEAVRADFRTAPVGERDRVMMEYADQITRDAVKIGPEHHARLRAVGFDDRGILQITLIAAWFNYINRVADAFGVGRS